MNCARQNQVNERIMEPKSKPKGTVLYTVWPVIDKVTLKQMDKGRIDARVNNWKALKLKAGFQTIAMISCMITAITGNNVQQSLRSYRNHSSAIVVKCCDRHDRRSVVSLWSQRLLNVVSSDCSDHSDDMETSVNDEWHFLVMIYQILSSVAF